jgi:plastocyanin
MPGSGFGKLSSEKLLIAAALIAISSGAVVGLSVGYVVHYSAPVTRTFYLFDGTLPFSEPTFYNIPHDIFVPDTLTVNKGDRVLIHYINIEDVSERHTFTMDLPYTFDVTLYGNATQQGVVGTYSNVGNVVLSQGQNATITFTANWAGVFKYYCLIHLPTMTGYLVVIG